MKSSIKSCLMDLTGMMVSIQSISIRFVSLTETKHLELSNQTFFDKHYFKFLPNKLLDEIHDTKKLLGACVEKVAECQIAPCPKCYSLFNLNGLTKPMKLKGVSLKKNSVESLKDLLNDVQTLTSNRSKIK